MANIEARLRRLERAIEKEKIPKTWSVIPPTQPGIYWVKLGSKGSRSRRVDIVRFQHMTDGRFPNGYGIYPTGHTPYRSWDEYGATHWLGPLPVPEPPK